jgi:hypothetical protein
MDWTQEIGSLLGAYAGANPAAAPSTVHDDFDEVARAAPSSAVADGLAAAFRSDHTPEFGDMLSQLFGQSPPDQRARILNDLIASVGPQVAGAILGRFQGSAAPPAGPVDEGTAARVPPAAVSEIAAAAEKKDPSIIERISQAYARQPQLVKTLGKVALTVALAQIASRQRSSR